MAKIPVEACREHDLSRDADASAFLQLFDEPEGSRILVIGNHDEPTAHVLASQGHKVTGVDLRGWDDKLPSCPYEFIDADFCSLAPTLLTKGRQFDVAVALSCIEHFGMGTYGDRRHAYYDVVALRYLWDLLRPDGRVYLSVPVGHSHIDCWPDWRVYSLESLQARLVQTFTVEKLTCFVAGPILVGEDIRLVRKDIGDKIALEDVVRYGGVPPHLDCLVVMRKDAALERQASTYQQHGKVAACEFVCCGCGKRAPGGYCCGSWTAPLGWFRRKDYDEPVLVCSRECDKKAGAGSPTVRILDIVT